MLQSPEVPFPPHGSQHALGTFSSMTRAWDNTQHARTCQQQKGQHKHPQIYYPPLFHTTTICGHHVLCQIQHHLCHINYDLSLCQLVMYTLAPATTSEHGCQELFTYLPTSTNTMLSMLITFFQHATAYNVFWAKFWVV